MAKKNGGLPNLRQVDFARPGAKRAYNRELFREVAPVYDAVTRVLSMGRDRTWKAELIEWLPSSEWRAPQGPILCVDLACGTGDMGRLLQTRYPDACVVGFDQSAEMMKRGSGFTGGHSTVQSLQGDMSRIPLPDGCVDIVTGGYAIRNAPELRSVLAEIARVLRPGGTAAFLDFSKSNHPLVQVTQLGALSVWGKLWGWFYHRNPQVYGYIASSLSVFPCAGDLNEMFRDHGLTLVREKSEMMGMIRLQLLQKILN